MSKSWKDEPVSSNITLERVAVEELPKFIGISDSLDKKIAELIQTERRDAVRWFWGGEHLLAIDLPPEFKEAYEIEAEVEGTSTGYYDGGCTSGPADSWYPPEEEDEREIVSINFVIYDEEGDEIGQWAPEDLNPFDSFEIQLYEED